mmetsp:Transcript_47589/g.101127  ORF Transcript_47589/g.101127 Transcript_47589/m.101127 type:complete len:343 (-) Transcript_47589:352-1380(-)
MKYTSFSNGGSSSIAARTELPPQQHNSIESIFASPDLLVVILRLLVDDDFLPILSSFSLVSKNFHRASHCDQLWREVCYQRWKSKFGFYSRWENALADYCHSREDQNGPTKQQSRDKSESTTDFWKSRYFFEERDAARHLILAEELETLVFDFRFWIGQPTVADGRIVVKSGLLESASKEVRFSKPRQVSEISEEQDFSGPIWSARGNLIGHPCKEPGIEWFLDEELGIVQWGFVPNLWPQGHVQRLHNWGWQIQNPNVVLRSIDPTSLAKTLRVGADWDETNMDEIETECSRSGGKIDIANSSMWKDLLDTLENIPLRNTPSVNGFRVTADIPRAFVDQYE